MKNLELSSSNITAMYCPYCRKRGIHTRHRDATGRYVYTCPNCRKIQVYTN